MRDAFQLVRFSPYAPFPGFEEARERSELGLAPFQWQIVPAVDGRRQCLTTADGRHPTDADVCPVAVRMATYRQKKQTKKQTEIQRKGTKIRISIEYIFGFKPTTIRTRKHIAGRHSGHEPLRLLL